MSIGKHIEKKAVGILSVIMVVVLAGCQVSENTAEQAGQVNMTAQAPAAAQKENELREDHQDNINRKFGDTAEVLTENLTNTVNIGADETMGETVQEDRQEKKQPPAGWKLNLATEDWGLSFGESGTQPTGNAAAEDLAWYDAYYVGGDDEKVIYLTFDCGYENGNTEPILDALKKHDVKATFFVVGHFLETAPDMAKRMVAEGHAVGNHTYHHPDMSAISDREAFQSEMDDVANLFHEITGTELSMYYRPPQGKCNEQNLKMAQELGYDTIFWSLAYVDWNQDDQPSHEEAFEKLTTRVHPGAIVLLHNTSQTNGEILDELLTRWEEMGYSFKPLSELTGE